MSSITIDHLGEGWRMFRRHLLVKGENFTSIADNAEDICKTTLKKLFYDKYFHTSLGNYPQFYSRDFGRMTESLLALGKKKEVEATLEYALGIFSTQGKTTTQITPKGKAINFPNVYSPDTLASLLTSLRLLGSQPILNKHRAFLQTEVDTYVQEVLDKEGMVKRHAHFGSMRDHSIRDASCYDVVMTAVVKREAKSLGLHWNAKKVDYVEVLMKQYWTGTYFKDNLSENKISADANIYPFYLDIISNTEILKKAIKSMQETGLDKPFPAKYVQSSADSGKTLWFESIVGDWENQSLWPWIGLPYINILSRVDKKKAKFHLEQYKKLMEKYKTFIEVYDEKGRPFSSTFFSADEGMIWCAEWLALHKKITS